MSWYDIKPQSIWYLRMFSISLTMPFMSHQITSIATQLQVLITIMTPIIAPKTS